MIPVARTEKLLIQAVGNEVVVYDRDNHTSHCLSAIAASVWHHCDGHNTVEDIARCIEQELNIPADSGVDIRGLVDRALAELEQNRLLDPDLRSPVAVSAMSRRQMVKTATLVGGLAIGAMLPLVTSILAPTPAMAQSCQPVAGCPAPIDPDDYPRE